MMRKGIFITGTDTGVGKTFVAAGLLKAMRKMGLNVCPMKPLETGCRVKNGKLIPQDALELIKASGAEEPVEIVSPYIFRQPLAPAIAAELDKVIIKKKKILSAFKYLLNKYDITVVEGAGGIMAPVYKENLFIDLIKDFGLPVIIVARPGLGTINHTLLTIKAAQSSRLNVLGIIINYASKAKGDLSEETNPEIIERLGKAQVLGIIPYLRNQISLGKIFHKITLELLKKI